MDKNRHIGADLKNELKEFIIGNYMAGIKNASLSDTDSFLDNGIIDSIGVIELIHFIQDKYGIKIDVPDIVPENFDTLSNLCRYISRKSS